MVFYNDKESTELSQRDKGSNVIQLHCHNKLISSIDKKIEWGYASYHGEIRAQINCDINGRPIHCYNEKLIEALLKIAMHGRVRFEVFVLFLYW